MRGPPFILSDAGLARPLVQNYRQEGPDMDLVEIVKEAPDKAQRSLERLGEDFDAPGRYGAPADPNGALPQGERASRAAAAPVIAALRRTKSPWAVAQGLPAGLAARGRLAPYLGLRRGAAAQRSQVRQEGAQDQGHLGVHGGAAHLSIDGAASGGAAARARGSPRRSAGGAPAA
ncbi:MAG TPA: hypothetical protein VFH51_14225, partial [Myxococcota bacterium]|nr:hypothetical protein [Myxococcota bacterium]